METRTCPLCGHPPPIEARFCPATGQEIPEQPTLCPQCGQNLRPDWIACPNCGMRLQGSLPQHQAAYTQPQPRPKRRIRWLLVPGFLLLLVLVSRGGKILKLLVTESFSGALIFKIYLPGTVS